MSQIISRFGNMQLSLKLLLIFCLVPLIGFSQVAKKNELPKKTRILFILDASGSMVEKWEGKTRMEVAKSVLARLVDSLKTQKNLETALRVYGHQFDKKVNNCKDTKLEVPFKANNQDAIKAKLARINPRGTTLISYSLEQSANDFPPDPNGRNIIILLTDGVESCGGDPCKLSRALSKKRIFLKPFIIGMGANQDFTKAFDCMGTYYDASSVAVFNQIMQKIVKETLMPTFVKIRLLDTHNKPTETNVNVSLINNFTDETEYDFVHYMDANGQPDALKIDPILTYHVVVNTIPKVIKSNVEIEPGKNNIIEVKCPQGAIYIRNDYKEFKNLQALVRQSGKSDIINIHKAGIKEKYLVGTYDIEILTLPRTKFENIKVNQSTVKELSIAGPGWLNISDSHQGFGSIYLIKNNGQQEWVTNLENETSKAALLLQPGRYKLVFRSSQSKGSEYTVVKNFSIQSGLSINLKLY